LYLYSIWFLISSLFLGDRSVHRLREDFSGDRSVHRLREDYSGGQLSPPEDEHSIARNM